MQWSQLPGAAAEVASIKDLFREQGAASFVDQQGALATEAAFRSVAPQCRIIHLATHGFFAPPEKKSAMQMRDQDPMDQLLDRDQHRFIGHSPGLLSGLVFAGANNPPEIPDDPTKYDDLPDDGILTADEIATLPLDGVELAVLSACDTGLGEVAGGEGLLGVQRAFQVAGVDSTIASLWKVDDQATMKIMTRFYHNYLEQEMTPLDALREAQLWALNNPESINDREPDARGLQSGLTIIDKPKRNRRLSPRYWAAFVYAGNPQ